MKQKTKRILALAAAVAATLTMGMSVSAAPVDEATIDHTRTGSLNIYKYDLSAAENDGVWDSTYVSTGVFDQTGVNDILGNPNDPHELPNGDISYGYAVKGVTFTYLKVADIYTFSNYGTISTLYGFAADSTGETMLSAIGMSFDDRVATADRVVDGKQMYYFTSDSLYAALADSLAANPTTVKDALEVYITANGGTAMAETDSYGHTAAEDLPLGLYLVVETAVPEYIFNTTPPFFASVPMTSVNGTNATDGGTRWIYDVTVYPKNQSAMPTLDKTVRESKEDTGKNEGATDNITDGYAHTATGSDGDVVEYQILSTLPPITSAASYLTNYTYVDTLSKGIAYNKADVVVEFFKDAACTELVTSWKETDETPKFTVTYDAGDNGSSTMTVAMTKAGLQEINTSKAVYAAESDTNSGYSSCTMRITYAATVNSDATVIYGNSGNSNAVVLTWERTGEGYFDTLKSDAHVYTYGLDLTKVFSDNKGDFANVHFALFNETDGYYVQAVLTDGIYYVTGHTALETEATSFVPTDEGKVIVKGLEDDVYVLTETATDNKYQLLENDIRIAITATEGDVDCTTCLNKLLVVSATVNDQAVTMTEDNGSLSALVPLTVINYTETAIPNTGATGMTVLVAGGMVLAFGSIAILAFSRKSKEEDTEQQS